MERVEREAEALRSRADKQLTNAQLREEASMLSVYGLTGVVAGVAMVTAMQTSYKLRSLPVKLSIKKPLN